MQAQLILAVLIFLAWPCFGNKSFTNPLENRKEKQSIYLDENGMAKIRALSSQLEEIGVNKEELEAIYQAVFSTSVANRKQVCEIQLLKELTHQVPWQSMMVRKKMMHNVLLHLRMKNFLDDVSTKYLLTAWEIISNETDDYLENINNRDLKKWTTLFDRDVQLKSAAAFKEFSRNEKNKLGAWKKTVEQLNLFSKQEEQLNEQELYGLLALTYRKRAFCRQDLKLMENLIRSKAHNLKSNLQDYLRVRDLASSKGIAKTSFSNIKAKKKKTSLRQDFYEKYTGSTYNRQQVEALGELMVQFKDIVFNSEVTIQINTMDKQEDIQLSYLEQYHFAVKLLKKEMTELEKKYFFYKENKKIEMMDVLIAADELGLIPAEAMEEIAAMEKSWRPEETKKNKIKEWASTAESVGAAILPTPFNYILTGGVILVEVLSKEEDHEKNEKDYNLF